MMGSVKSDFFGLFGVNFSYGVYLFFVISGFIMGIFFLKTASVS